MPDEAVAEVIEDDILEQVDAESEVEEEITESEDGATDVEAQAETKEEPEPSESSAEKKDDGFQKRIDELTQRYYTEKQRGDTYEAQVRAAQQAIPKFEAGKTLADFDYDEGQYSTYLLGQARADAQAEVQRNIQQESASKARVAFEVKEAGFATDVPDYQAVTRNPALMITPAIVETLQNAEKGPDVLYYLGKHPDITASLANMSPLDAARELGKIEATKLIKPEPPKSKTPAPVPKIKGTDTATSRVRSDSPDSDKLSDAEWLKRENKRIANRK